MSQKFPLGGPGGGPAQNPQQMLQQAVRLHQGGRLPEAVKLYQQVLKSHPGNPQVLTYCGAAMLDLKRTFEGTQMLQSAIAADPANADAHSFLGNAHQMAGRLEKAEDCYATALEITPGNAQLQNNMGVLLQRMERNEDAVNRFRCAIDLQPDYAQAHNNLSQALAETGQVDQAIAAAEKAVELQPPYADGHNTLGTALSKAGRMKDAVHAFQNALALQPKFPGALKNLAVAQIIAGQPDAAVDACDKSLEMDPTSVPALATKAVALSEARRMDELNHLVDLDRNVQAHMIDPTPDFPDVDSFNTALVQHIVNHPSLTYELDGHATRKGKHTGELLTEPKGPMATFERMINRAVEAYRATLDADYDHPVARTAPNKWKLTAWSVVLEEAGHQIPHIHESGWLSGVYYPKVPRDMGPSEDDPTGWIEFGLPQDLYQVRHTPPLKLFEPVEGKMILFPSYFFHRTVPTGSQDLRVSIAFDVMRAG